MVLLSPTLFDCSHLAKLDLSENFLIRIPEKIGQLKSLRRFEARSNQLESLPDTLASCPHLEGLSLTKNRLKDVPLWFYRLHHLAQLDLATT